MTERSYRVTLRGRFGTLTHGQRSELLAQQHLHDMFAAKYTPEGTFLYEPELVGFQFRFELVSNEPSPEDAELEVAMVAEELAARQFANKGIAGRIVQTTLVSMDTIKVRAQGRTA